MFLLFSIQYGAQLEKVSFQFSTADFVYMLLVGMAALLVSPSTPASQSSPPCQARANKHCS